MYYYISYSGGLPAAVPALLNISLLTRVPGCSPAGAISVSHSDSRPTHTHMEVTHTPYNHNISVRYHRYLVCCSRRCYISLSLQKHGSFTRWCYYGYNKFCAIYILLKYLKVTRCDTTTYMCILL